MPQLRDQIISEIKRLAEQNKGRPPGIRLFERETGITEARWRGIFWARWSDALKEAGYVPNELNPSRNAEVVFTKIAQACRHFGHWPTFAELKLYRRMQDPEAPSIEAIRNRYSRQLELVRAVRQWVATNHEFADILQFLPIQSAELDAPVGEVSRKGLVGCVYLVKSGEYYKIGRSDDLERRIKEIRTSLPDAATLVHVINTDDTAGIEAYWHRRFAERRMNGEWFKLSSSDVAAFRRRRFQ